MAKTILLTGYTGFVGKHLINSLSDYKLVGLSRYSDNTIDNITLNLDNDINDNDIKLALKQYSVDIIIHLASITCNKSNIDDIDILKKNLTISKNLSKIANYLQPDQLINFSSSSVYPNVNGSYSEDSIVKPQENTDCLYGLSKFNSEVIIDYFTNKNINVTHLRVAQIFGDGMRQDRIFPIMKNELLNDNIIEIFGNGKRIINYIEINELVLIIIKLIKISFSGTLNLCSNNLKIIEIANELIKKFGNKDSKVFFKKITNVDNEFILDTKKSKELGLI